MNDVYIQAIFCHKIVQSRFDAPKARQYYVINGRTWGVSFACSRNDAAPFGSFWWWQCCWSWKYTVSCNVGIRSEICSHLWTWDMIDPSDFTMGKAGSCHLLWALKLLKLCATASFLCALLLEVRKWSWRFVSAGNHWIDTKCSYQQLLNLLLITIFAKYIGIPFSVRYCTTIASSAT